MTTTRDPSSTVQARVADERHVLKADLESSCNAYRTSSDGFHLLLNFVYSAPELVLTASSDALSPGESLLQVPVTKEH